MPAKPFGLTENPFAAGHDRRFIYPSRKRDEALTAIRKAISDRAPFVLVTGDPGIGKTSVVWEALGATALMARVGAVVLSSPGQGDLLEAACRQFDVAIPTPPDRSEMIARLERQLCELRGRARIAVLVVDDAHGIEPAQLEQIQTLSEMQADGRGLMQTVLVGLPELERRLGRPEHAQLRERITHDVRIAPLGVDETERYLHHRVKVAGGSGGALFPSDTCREIHSYTYGFPRDINVLAERVLERAQKEGAHAVKPDHVRAAIAAARLKGETAAPRPEADVPTLSPTPPEPAAGRASRPAAPAVARPAPSAATRAPVPAPASAITTASPADPSSPRVPGTLRWGQEIETLRAPRGGASSRRSPLQGPDPNPAPAARSRPENALHVTLAAVAVIGVMVMVMFVMRSWDRNPPPEPAPSPITAAPEEAGKLPVAPAVKGARPGRARATTRSPRAADANPTSRPVAVIPSPPSDARGSIAPMTDAGPGAARGGFGLEVASFIDPGRAAAEAERITGATGQPCQVVTDADSDSYLLVLGFFASRRAAERVAEDLLGRELVHQARVVAIAGDSP